MQIAGATLLITGASQGIGRACCIAAAEKGAACIIAVARNETELLRLGEELKEKTKRFIPLKCDLSDLHQTRELIETIRSMNLHPDILINNAGAGRWLFIEDTDALEIEQMIAVPFLAAMRLCQAFVPGMIQRKKGHILNVNSPAAEIAFKGAAGYSVARQALKGLSLSLQADLKGTGVGVTHFVTGKVSSHYFEANPGSEERIPWIAGMIPTLSPDVVAKSILQAIESEKKVRIIPFLLRVFAWLNRHVPALVSAFLDIKATGRKLR